MPEDKQPPHQAPIPEGLRVQLEQFKKQLWKIKITEAIPDPIVTLKAPAKWDGRKTIEIAPQIANLKKMQATSAGKLQYKWHVSGLAVIKEIAPGKLILKRAQNSGKMSVKLTVSNGGKPVSSIANVMVTEPKKDAWVYRTPGKNEQPEDNQFYARDDKNEGTLYCNGTLAKPADSVVLKLYANGVLILTTAQKPKAGKTYALTVKLKPGLIKYTVKLAAKTGQVETV